MSDELKTFLFIILAVLLIGGIMRSSWKMLKRSEKMLDQVDKSKLKNYDQDDY